jgi:hypothetical protein
MNNPEHLDAEISDTLHSFAIENGKNCMLDLCFPLGRMLTGRL